VVLIVLVASLRGLAGFWLNYLWFESVGFTSVFRGVLLTKVILSLVFVTIFFFLMWGNLVISDRLAPEEVDPAQANELVNRYREVVLPRGRWVRIATSGVFALLAGVGADREWNNWDLFRYSLNFGVKDPQFHNDVGFYVFKLPFIEFLIGWMFEALIVVLIVTALSHYLNGGILPQSPGNRATSAVKAHLSVLLGALALVKGVDYYFQRVELALSRSHVVNGATATSVHANMPALTLLMVIAGIAAALFLYNIRQRGWLLPVVGVGLWVLVALLIGDAYPAIYQAVRVSPSELTREKPYIQRNIDATQTAYGLKNVSVQTYPGYQYTPTVATSQVGATVGQPGSNQQQYNQETIANLRLFDPQVSGLLNTVDKYQALRSYYSFNDLDPDRYVLNVNGTSTEMATVASVRELNAGVPSGFVNKHLTYTHGYGTVVAPIGENGFNPNGTPSFSLSGLPPTGQPQLTDNGSQVYYGLGPNTNGYVIADSKTPELDYESNTGQQIETRYAGKGGVEAGSLIRRAAFALSFGDPNFVLSGQITPSSRVMFIRNAVSRVHKAAPFLKLDSDPYAVILNGQVYWVVDAYTTTDNYPYSQNANVDRVPSNSGLDSTFNYVRNSVKVVVSAYDGSMYFVDMGTGDPILRVYEKAFPDLFISLAQLNQKLPGMQAHFRYPEDLFRVQTTMYGRYHLSGAADFYSQAQAWAVSPDPGVGELQQTTQTTTASGAILPSSVPRLQPQYILAHLPGSNTPLNFMLITPYVPISSSTTSQNLTAYVTADSDPGPSYGQLSLFEMPPGQTVDGPSLISSAIRSNQAISSELTLYDQRGSQVELGEVSIIPIDQSLLYVQPVYVESSSNPIPTLDDVVVVYQGHAYHSSNASLDGALCQITNPDGTQPFKAYCNTAAANSGPLVSSTGPTSGATGSKSSTSTSASTTTTTPPPSSGAPSVASLLAQAQQDLAAAQQAAAAGNQSAAAADYAKAQAEVAQAQKLISGG
jgi:uncharacterized membrane protein (UPF0182 family)